jgi:hypothetical protein
METFIAGAAIVIFAVIILGAFATRAAIWFSKLIYGIAPYIVILAAVCLALYFTRGYILPPDESVGTVDAAYP